MTLDYASNSDKMDMYIEASGRAIDAMTSAVAGELASGGSCALVGFGTFSVSHRAARAGRNPATGETIQIKASNVPKFKAGKALKDACN